jgi:hypothetical protein
MPGALLEERFELDPRPLGLLRAVWLGCSGAIPGPGAPFALRREGNEKAAEPLRAMLPLSTCPGCLFPRDQRMTGMNPLTSRLR